MSGHPEREGGEGWGQPCSTETQIHFQIANCQIPDSEFNQATAKHRCSHEFTSVVVNVNTSTLFSS